ncbi:MAG TPA: SAM domain-containing protein, partial [Roseiarcus sp.]|nr:SAM domain-containing protein [Roseiarcus sp.]
MDIGEWLRGLSLDCYEGVFRDNKIGADVLPRLTADDLKEMGVFAIGDRHRILAAIAALAPAAPCSAEAGVSLRHISSRLGERRPVTVMFCDLVGST